MDTHLAALPTGTIEKELLDREVHIAALRAEQAEMIGELDRRQIPTAHGCRSIHEWVAGRLDVARRTAQQLVALSRIGNTDVLRDVADGEITVDRAIAESRLALCGVSDDVRRDSRRIGIRGVHRLADRHRRVTRIDEAEAHSRRYLTAQPNLDESAWDVPVRLPGLDGKAFTELVDRAADALPDGPDGRASLGQRRADGLMMLVMDGGDAAIEGGETPCWPRCSSMQSSPTSPAARRAPRSSAGRGSGRACSK